MKKYYDFENLLGSFFLDATYYPERTDEETIRRFMEEMGEEAVRETIEEGRAVLALDPFPWEWVSHLTNGFPCKPGEEKIYTKEYLVKKWVTWMIEALEEEGKRSGKLRELSAEEMLAREEKKELAKKEYDERERWWSKYPILKELIWEYTIHDLLIGAGLRGVSGRYDLAPIIKFVNESEILVIKKILQEKLDFFQEKEVIIAEMLEKSANIKHFLEYAYSNEINTTFYNQWIKMVFETLEEEAKKAGKL